MPKPQKPKTYHGEAAVRQVQKREGRKLSPAERRVVFEEGYVDGTYKDTKGILTGGVGQTGEWIQRGFKASFDHHVERVRKRVPGYDRLPSYVQEELVQAEYRGDLGLSPKAVGYLNQGQYRKAAIEFLNNDEFRNPKTPASIRRRMKSVADSFIQLEQDVKSSGVAP